MAKTHPEQLFQADKEGRTVLALALESGHSMVENPQGARYPIWHENRKDNPDSFCIRKLVKLDIRTLVLRDPKTRLYPFQTAASMEERIVELLVQNDPHIRGRADSDFEERIIKARRDSAPLICLNTIYYLLSADPSALEGLPRKPNL